MPKKKGMLQLFSVKPESVSRMREKGDSLFHATLISSFHSFCSPRNRWQIEGKIRGRKRRENMREGGGHQAPALQPYNAIVTQKRFDSYGSRCPVKGRLSFGHFVCRARLLTVRTWLQDGLRFFPLGNWDYVILPLYEGCFPES